MSLASDKGLGYGMVGEVPWTAIDRYAERFGIRNVRRFERLIRGMDAAYERHRERMTPRPVGK
jgi:hypothetical protein